MKPFQKTIKRIIDLILAPIIFVFFWPLLVIVIILLKIEAPGPVIVRQTRVGQDGKTFGFYKFRTMRSNADGYEITRRSSKDDHRITPLGAFLRNTSLDRLPMFLNVIKGDMSIVGPMPYLLAQVEHHNKSLNTDYDFSMRPGVTGWAQIKFHSGEINRAEIMTQVIELDKYYVNNWSVFFDLKIILLTLKSAFLGKNGF